MTINSCLSLSVADIPSSVDWRSPFKSLCNHRQLTEFYVLHIEKATPTDTPTSTTNLSEKVGPPYLLYLTCTIDPSNLDPSNLDPLK